MPLSNFQFSKSVFFFQVHAFNILKAIVADKLVGAEMHSFLSRCMILALGAFSSPVRGWSRRLSEKDCHDPLCSLLRPRRFPFLRSQSHSHPLFSISPFLPHSRWPVLTLLSVLSSIHPLSFLNVVLLFLTLIAAPFFAYYSP